MTEFQIAKRDIGPLCAGDWPCGEQILDYLPEFHGTAVVFDGVARQEWMRCWDMRFVRDGACVEYGIY